MLSFFFLQTALADTVILKNGKELKGLVVEKHADRIILSTEKGEIPILLKGITNIQYDDPEQNFLEIGKGYEAENKLGEALAYYEKALELNPNFEEARKAAVGVRNRFWAMTTEGPKGEMEKQQVLYDSWGQGRSPEDMQKTQVTEDAKALRDGLGLALGHKGDWVQISQLTSKKDAAVAGLKRGDRLVAIDGASLRYLGAEVVAKKFLLPRYSNFTLEFERDCLIHRDEDGNIPRDLGLKLKLEYQGVVVQSVKAGSPAADAGIKTGDLIAEVNGSSTRYMPLKQVMSVIQGSKQNSAAVTVRRAALLTRR